MRKPYPVPDEVERMHPRQRDILRVIYRTGGATAREIHAQIPDPPRSRCGIRTLLSRLSRRGYVFSRPSGRHRERIYLPARSDTIARAAAFNRLAKTYFGGSRTRAINALCVLAAAEGASGPNPAQHELTTVAD